MTHLRRNRRRWAALGLAAGLATVAIGLTATSAYADPPGTTSPPAAHVTTGH